MVKVSLLNIYHSTAITGRYSKRLQEEENFTHSFDVLCLQSGVKHDGSESDSDASISTGRTSSGCRAQLCQLSAHSIETPVTHTTIGFVSKQLVI